MFERRGRTRCRDQRSQRGGGGTISLAPGCTYALTTPNNGENGLPVVITPISVFGNGATITGSGAVRIFEVDGPGGNLSLRNVTLTGGSASDFGGAIFNSSGTVTLNQSVVTGNSAVTAGGGIASGTFGPTTATLILNGSLVTNNSSPGTGNFDGSGGGIVNAQGNATLNFTRVSNNFAGGPSGGGIATGNLMGSPGPTSQLTLNFSQVNNNTAPNAGGGGIQNLAGNVAINVSQVNGNTSLNGGGIASGNGAGGGPGGPPPGTSFAHPLLQPGERQHGDGAGPGSRTDVGSPDRGRWYRQRRQRCDQRQRG